MSDFAGSDGLALKRLMPTLTRAPAVIRAWLSAVDSFKGNLRMDWHRGTKMAPPPTPAVDARDPTYKHMQAMESFEIQPDEHHRNYHMWIPVSESFIDSVH